MKPLSNDPAEIARHMTSEEGKQMMRLWLQLFDPRDPLHKLDPGKLKDKTDEELRVLLDEMVKSLLTVLRVRFRQAGLDEVADLPDDQLGELAQILRREKMQ